MSVRATIQQENDDYKEPTFQKPMLSIVTATYNAERDLPHLIQSLRTQTDTNFEWVVADGGSTDATLALLTEASKELNVRVDSREDFGIYDALNRAIRIAKGVYYVVMGADDVLFANAVADYHAACQDGYPDLVTAKVEWGGSIRGVRQVRWEWLNCMEAHISAHAVGLAIKRDLHEHYGWYTKCLPIAADQVFVLRALHGGCELHEEHFVAGRFATTGLSGSDRLGALTEKFRSQIFLGHGTLIQLALLNYRILKLIIKTGLITYLRRTRRHNSFSHLNDALKRNDAEGKN